MRTLSFLAALCMALAVLASPAHSGPLAQVSDSDGVTRLQGWARAPVAYAPNRITPERGADGSRVLTIQSEQTAFGPAIADSLAQDGVLDVQILAQRELSSATVTRFQEAADLRASRFMTWIAAGRDAAGPVKIAGFSIITAQGVDPGVSAEMFVAPVEAFEARGGWVVPTVRYFGLALHDPATDVSAHGRADDAEAVAAMAHFFEEWMGHITLGKTMAAIGTAQTLSMQQGFDQAQDTGLQDPLFDPNH